MRRFSHLAALIALLMATIGYGRAGAADDARPAERTYFFVPLEKLTLTEGALPADNSNANARGWAWRWSAASRAYAVLDGPGEAYVDDTGGNANGAPPVQGWNLVVAIRAAAAAAAAADGKDVTGRPSSRTATARAA